MPDQPTRVLLIDDEPHLLFAISAVMKRFGFEVDTAIDGASGLSHIKGQRPDIVVCDMMMPNMDGIALKSALNQQPETADIPFIFLTARAYQSDKLAGLSKGADDYVTKPCQPEELVERVHAVLRRHEAGRRQGRVEAAVMAEQALRFMYANGLRAGKMARCIEQIVYSQHFADRTLKLRTRDEFEARLDKLQGGSLYPLAFVTFGLAGLLDLDVRAAGNLLTQIVDALFRALGTDTMLFRLGPDQFLVLIPQSGSKLRQLHQLLRSELIQIRTRKGLEALGLSIGTAIAQKGDRLSGILSQAEEDMSPDLLEADA